ncbi:MAG: glycosyltransferase family 4 protein [Desulfamplus sp.]|nr:glycosyltransferase family 4 protein [Desulfamplus sp.]
MIQIFTDRFSMKILHIISQAPDFTGSGKYIQAILRCASENGYDNFLVAGVQSNGVQSDFSLNTEIISPEKTMFVRFNGIGLKTVDLKSVPWLLKSLRQVANKPSLQQHTDTESYLETAFSPLWHIHLAGGGSGCEKDECLELANELESASEVGSNSNVRNRVTVHGALSHEELSALMKKAHLFILPSFFEGLPLVVMEALACGCRVITTSLPGTCEVLGSCDSALLSNGDSEFLDSADSAISGNSYKNMVTLVELPELETVDKPYNKDLNHLEAILSNHIALSIEQIIQNPEPDQETSHRLTVNYTWEKVFERIDKVYYSQIQK